MDDNNQDNKYDIEPVFFSKIINNTIFALICLIVAIVSLKVLKVGAIAVAIMIAFAAFFIVIAVLYFIKQYNHEYFTIDAKCTAKRVDKIQIGFFQIYEFEPIDKKNKEIITLSLSNDETGGIFKKKIKIQEGSTYRLYFKNNKENLMNNQTYLGYERIAEDDEK